jgi:hypothetical protein
MSLAGYGTLISHFIPEIEPSQETAATLFCMVEYGHYPAGSIAPERLAKIETDIARETFDFTIAFVLNNEVRGSGTLVRAGGKVGILTAAHVADQFTRRAEQPVGLVISQHIHQFVLYPPFIERVDFLGELGPTDESGPDISFLRLLSLENIGTICARKSVYRLGGRSFAQFDDFPINLCLWRLAGTPDEFSTKDPARAPHDPVLAATILTGACDFGSIERTERFDIIRLKVPAGSYNFPSNYGGVSGGGIWVSRLTMYPDKGLDSVSYESPFLAGVAFCQGAIDNNGERTIICHGPASIYDHTADF